jgi:predicted nucleic acid-binding protein
LIYLVDSDWSVDALAGIPSAVEPLRGRDASDLAVSIITFGEIFDGAFGFPDPKTHLATFRQFLAGFAVLGLSDPIMELFGQNRALLRRQGTLIPDL